MRKLNKIIGLIFIIGGFGLFLYSIFSNSLLVLPQTGTSDYVIKYNRKVLILNYDPLIQSSGKLLHEEYEYQDPYVTLADFRDELYTTTNERVYFEFVSLPQVEKYINEYPIKADGFQYTEETYKACRADSTKCHDPDLADYSVILNNYNVCSLTNSGVVDEVWLIGAPYMGFQSTALSGPANIVKDRLFIPNNACMKSFVIGGFGYNVPSSISVLFSMRAFNILNAAYPDQTENNFSRFRQYKTENNLYGGCGNYASPPNSETDFEYSSITYVPSNCDDFYNYPNLKTVIVEDLPLINCSAWDCQNPEPTLGYNRTQFQFWWLKHIPHVDSLEKGPDGRFMDWWEYILDPNTILTGIPIGVPVNITNTPTPPPFSIIPISGTETVETPPVRTPLPGVYCGYMDENRDGKLNYIDLDAFVKVYNQICQDTPPPYNGCQGKDTRIMIGSDLIYDDFIDYKDLDSLAKRYFNITESCNLIDIPTPTPTPVYIIVPSPYATIAPSYTITPIPTTITPTFGATVVGTILPTPTLPPF